LRPQGDDLLAQTGEVALVCFADLVVVVCIAVLSSIVTRDQGSLRSPD
jgi:hypothetical protein